MGLYVNTQMVHVSISSVQDTSPSSTIIQVCILHTHTNVCPHLCTSIQGNR